MEPAPAPSLDRARVERQLERMEELAQLGMRMLRVIVERAEAPESDAEALALAHTRVARAVRLADLLQSRLKDDLAARERGAEAAAAASAGAGARAGYGLARIIRVRPPRDRLDAETLMDDDAEAADAEAGDGLDESLAEMFKRTFREAGLQVDPDEVDRAVRAMEAEEAAGCDGGADSRPPVRIDEPVFTTLTREAGRHVLRNAPRPSAPVLDSG